MPVGHGSELAPFGQNALLAALKERWPGARPYRTKSGGNGPARYWIAPELKGAVGFISAVSHEFCASLQPGAADQRGIFKAVPMLRRRGGSPGPAAGRGVRGRTGRTAAAGCSSKARPPFLWERPGTGGTDHVSDRGIGRGLRTGGTQALPLGCQVTARSASML